MKSNPGSSRRLASHRGGTRLLASADLAPGAEKVAVISEQVARQVFGEPRSALGQAIGTTRIVGVMPADFHFPTALEKVWTPLSSIDTPATIAGLARGASLHAVEGAIQAVNQVGRSGSRSRSGADPRRPPLGRGSGSPSGDEFRGVHLGRRLRALCDAVRRSGVPAALDRSQRRQVSSSRQPWTARASMSSNVLWAHHAGSDGKPPWRRRPCSPAQGRRSGWRLRRGPHPYWPPACPAQSFRCSRTRLISTSVCSCLWRRLPSS